MPPRRGPRIDPLVFAFDFKPTVGMVAKDMDLLGMDIRSFRVPLEQSIREVLMPSIEANFEAEGRPSKWEDLSDHTVLIRGSAHPVLERSGALKRAATSFDIWSISDVAATVTGLPEDVSYGSVHQAGYGKTGKGVSGKTTPNMSPSQIREALGGQGKGQGIPQRQFVMIHEDDEQKIQQVFARWLGSRLRRHRLGKGL